MLRALLSLPAIPLPSVRLWCLKRKAVLIEAVALNHTLAAPMQAGRQLHVLSSLLVVSARFHYILFTCAYLSGTICLSRLQMMHRQHCQQ